MYRLRIAEPAERDFRHITTYIMEALDEPAAAFLFMDEVDACYVRIQENPYLYEQCRNPRLQREGYHRAVIGNYIMVYRPCDETKTVEIHRFFYGPQNYTKLI